MTQISSFYFMRHGETDWNRRRCFMGSQDIPMNATGWAQLDASLPTLARLGVETIVTSPLKRAHEMAVRIGEELGKEVIVAPQLREASWGKHEGKEIDFTDFLYRWHNGDEIVGVEAFLDFTTRVAQGVAFALEQPGSVLIVSHGGVFAAIQRILGHEPSDLGNCEICEVSPGEIKPLQSL